MEKIIPGILDRRYSYLKLKLKGSMNLSVEWIEENKISIMHTYIQNGDLMRDPDIEIMVDSESKMLFPKTYRQDSLGIFQDIELTNNKLKLSTELSEFLNTWLKNIEIQNYKPVLAHLQNYDDKEIKFSKEGKEIIFEDDLFSNMSYDGNIKKPYNNTLDISLVVEKKSNSKEKNLSTEKKKEISL